MTLPSQLEAIHKIVGILERNKVDYMLIGGWALPAYGHVRSTMDVDLAIAIKESEKLTRLVSELHANNYQIPCNPSLKDRVFQMLDKDNMVEIELWQKPDGINIDNALLKRRQKREAHGVSFWIIGPEDLVVNKLSRPDRSPIDEQDVITVLVRQKGRLDRRYLEKQAKKAGVYGLLEILETRAEETRARTYTSQEAA